MRIRDSRFLSLVFFLVFAGMSSAQFLPMGPGGGTWSGIHFWNDSQSAAGYGTRTASAGDVNGDGYDDVLVGAPSWKDANGTPVGSVWVYSGATGAVLWNWTGDPAWSTFGASEFGAALAGAGDVDGDGLDDVLVGAPEAATAAIQSGAVFLYSGATGALLLQVDGNANDRMGSAVAGLDDLDGDGVVDFVVGADRAPSANPFVKGLAYLISGQTGGVVATLDDGVSLFGKFGSRLAALGDVDGDGFRDLTVAEPFGAAGGLGAAGRLVVYSGAPASPGAVLYTISGGEIAGHLGSSVASAGDVDGDGLDDIVAGAPEEGSVGQGFVYVFSGQNGAVLHQVTPSGLLPGARAGRSVAGAGDVNGDGLSDFVLGAPGAGRVELRDGVTGTLLRAWTGNDLGTALARGGDVNGDGAEDLLIGAAVDLPGFNSDYGYVFADTPVADDFFAQFGTLSVSGFYGAMLQFFLLRSSTLPMEQYVVLGSASGLGPGFAFAGHTIPLNMPDVYFSLITTYANVGFFSQTLGSIANGNAFPALVLPPGGLSPSLVGIELHHVAVTFTPTAGITWVSRPVATRLIP